jgi:hypothetical protein
MGKVEHSIADQTYEQMQKALSDARPASEPLTAFIVGIGIIQAIEAQTKAIKSLENRLQYIVDNHSK